MTPKEKAEWLEKRRKCITGTDIASIVGLNRYGSPMSVFMDKMGLSQSIFENEPMKWGKALEPVIAARYADDNGVVLKQGEFLLKNDIFGGTPDYLSPSKLIEIKTAGMYAGRLWGDPGSDSIPDSYMCQVQWYLNLCDMDKADVAVLIAGQDYRIYHVNRNQNLIDLLIGSAETFWEEHIIPQLPPPIDATEGSKAFLQSFFPRSSGNMLEPTHDSAAMARELHDIRISIDTFEKRKTLLENQLKLAIGDNDGILGNNFKITWRSAKDSVKTDWEKLVRDMNVSPELIKEFSKTVAGSRRFIVKFDEDYNDN